MARMRVLLDAGLVAGAGREAFALRSPNESGVFACEQRSVELPPQYARVLRANPRAWRNYRARPPPYRTTVKGSVVSAKRQPTRERRLRELIEAAAG